MLKFSMLLVATLTALSAQDKTIDVQRSTITIHVGKAGLFSAAGHEHWVSAPISSGKFSASRVEFKVATAKMAVKPDPKVDEKTRLQVQKDMEEMTLEPARYPEISFESSHVEKVAEGQWRVVGTLSMHGVARPVSVIVRHSGDSYTGHVTIKQTEFGIKPVSVAGGTIKVKNEVDIEFNIFARAA